MKRTLLIAMMSAALSAFYFALGQTPPAPTPGLGSSESIINAIEEDEAEMEKKVASAVEKLIGKIRTTHGVSSERADMIVKDLHESQRAWEEFRQKQSSFLYSYWYDKIGSTGARYAGVWHYERQMMDQRIKELDEPPGYF